MEKIVIEYSAELFISATEAYVYACVVPSNWFIPMEEVGDTFFGYMECKARSLISFESCLSKAESKCLSRLRSCIEQDTCFIFHIEIIEEMRERHNKEIRQYARSGLYEKYFM